MRRAVDLGLVSAETHPESSAVQSDFEHTISAYMRDKTNLVLQCVKFTRYDLQHDFVRQEATPCNDLFRKLTNLGPVTIEREHRPTCQWRIQANLSAICWRSKSPVDNETILSYFLSRRPESVPLPAPGFPNMIIRSVFPVSAAALSLSARCTPGRKLKGRAFADEAELPNARAAGCGIERTTLEDDARALGLERRIADIVAERERGVRLRAVE